MYIALEGVKGCGKSLLSDTLLDRFKYQKIPVILIAPTRKNKQLSYMEYFNELFPCLRNSDLWMELLYASRARSEAKKISNVNQLFIGDRSIVTSYVTRWNKWANKKYCIKRVDMLEATIPAPDHILYLNVDKETALSRINSRQGRNYGKQDETPERIQETLDNYYEIMNANIPKLKETKWHIVDSNRLFNDVFKQVAEILYMITNIKIEY